MTERVLATTEEVRLQGSQDFVGAAYENIVQAATASYWVVPINTDHQEFTRWAVTDTSQEGLVHYSSVDEQ